MKLKNIQVGDRIQAKSDICSSDIRKGEIVEVVNVDPYYHDDGLSVRVRFRGQSEWANHKDFHKAYQDGAGK